MDYAELLIAMGLIVVATVLYLLLRKFISWCIDDDRKFHQKRGHLTLSEKTHEVNKQAANDKLTGGYALVLFLLVIYIIKLIFDAQS